MKKIEKYQADDGTEFWEESKCLDYEQISQTVKVLMAELVPRPKSIHFDNGHGFIQQERHIALRVRREILSLVATKTDMRWIPESIENENVDPSFAGRIIGELGIKPLERAWYRFECMTSDFREFGHPKFRLNPSPDDNFDFYKAAKRRMMERLDREKNHPDNDWLLPGRAFFPT